MIKLLKKLFHKPRRRNLPYRVNYHEGWLLPPAAIFVGTYMVLYTSARSFGEAIFMADFYKAVIPSILAAWVVMWCIVKVMYVLDASHPWAITWYRGPLARAGLQVGLGVIMPAFFIFGVFAVYFLARGRSDLIIRYAVEDFPFVLVMLSGFSTISWLYYRVRTREIMRKFRAWKREYGKTLAEMEARWKEGSIEMDIVPDPDRAKTWLALLEPYRKGNGSASWSTDFEGRRERQPYTMKAFYNKAEGPDFFKVRHELIVNRAAIREVDADGPDAIIVLASGRPDERIKVSDRKREAFLGWWKGGGFFD